MASVNQEFESAPMGGAVVAKLAIVLIALAGAVAATAIAQRTAHGMPAAARAATLLAPFAGFALVLALHFVERSRVSRFRIDENCLVLGGKRYPLAGLSAIDRDREILRRAVRIRGNGGIGAIRGRYWSRRVGKFEAFMTDPEKAVVLRWPNQIVAVSPNDPDFFIYSARAAAGLK
jgi:Bacterial PH domain